MSIESNRGLVDRLQWLVTVAANYPDPRRSHFRQSELRLSRAPRSHRCVTIGNNDCALIGNVAVPTDQ